jgi:hypothetical protein
MNKIVDRQILSRFDGKGIFGRNDIVSLLRDLDPEISDSAAFWRMHDLVKRRIINQVKLGVYSLSIKEIYRPSGSDELARLHKVVAKDFHGLGYCLWTTEWLNDFTQHQLGTSFYVLEVEKDFVEEVFNAYSEFKQFRVYVNPTDDIMKRYIEQGSSIVIKPLIGRSPRQEIALREKSKDTVFVPTVEKILVDIFSDDVTFFSIQGSELDTIFKNALTRYQVNFTKLMSYAKRRNKDAQLKTYLNTNFSDFVQGILI